MDDRILSQFLSDGGALHSELPSFEERTSQKNLALFINQRINTETNALCEAGTGIGKSLAYLVPLIMYAIENSERCLVSTETIALQDQLFKKDIPLLVKALKRQKGKPSFKASLALGSANYLCRTRYDSLRLHLETHESALVETIDTLLSHKKAFSKLDLTVSSHIWERVCRDPDFCRGSKCGNYSTCTFQLARKSWFESNLIITNHSLFFSNIATDKKYLPPFEVVVLDEAHSAPDICRRQNGFFLHKGLLEKNEKILKECTFYKSRSKQLTQLKRSIEKAKNELALFFDTHRHTAGRLTTPLDAIVPSLTLLENLYVQSNKKFFDLNDSDIQYFDSFRNGIFTMIQAIRMLVDIPQTWVFWCDKSASAFHYYGEPLNAADIFIENIYPFYRSIIFISATLTVGNTFSFFEERCGITDHETVILGTEFNYRANAMAYLPPMPSPADKTFLEKAVFEIERLIALTAGKTLILFNSYDMLQKVCEKTKTDKEIISQLDYSAYDAVSLFKKTKDAVLMGTHSFWQGIDIAGEALSNLIITRLPFAPPDRPDIAALCEIYEDSMEAFFKIQLPMAVLKFRQGFGRLIRSTTDTGIITILDNRIVTKRYGKLFLESVPSVSLASQFEIVEKFYRSTKGITENINPEV